MSGDSVSAAAPDVPTQRAVRIRIILIALVLTIPYLWFTALGVGNLLALQAYAARVGGALNSFAWLVLGASIAAPPLVFALALVVSRRRGPLRVAAAGLAGLGLVACLSLGAETLLRF
jgi:hypothetical protein